MAEKPGVRTWRQPKDRQPKTHDVIARAAAQQDRWAGSLERQRDIISRLTEENRQLRQALEDAGLPDPTGRS